MQYANTVLKLNTIHLCVKLEPETSRAMPWNQWRILETKVLTSINKYMLGMLVQAAHYTIQGFLSSSKEGGDWKFCWGRGVFFLLHIIVLTIGTKAFHEYWTSIKIKTSMTCVSKENDIIKKLVQEQWLHYWSRLVWGWANFRLVGSPILPVWKTLQLVQK